MIKHTKEPWYVEDGWRWPIHKDLEKTPYISILGEKQGVSAAIVADIPVHGKPIEMENANRIVDCVNACIGIDPNVVPKMLDLLSRLCASEQFSSVDELRDLIAEARGEY